jgi:two-component system NtrC family sensor kinase
MRKFRPQCGKATCGYALFGIVFGICFPVIAITFDLVIYLGMDLNVENIKKIHEENPIHYIIDTAPFFLGIAFGVAGYFLDRARRLNASLRQQQTVLEDANVSLHKALDDFHEARELLVKSEKLASLGQLTAGIAHELKNPLNFINNFAESGEELVKELNDITDEEERKEIVEMLKGNFKIINEHGMRANTILQSMMAFARSSKIELRWADINQVSNDAADIAFHGICSTIIGFKCDFKRELGTDLPKVKIKYEDISRVILNLLTNAFYAVNERRNKVPDGYNPAVVLSTYLDISKVDGEKNIIIKVRDNGTGIPEKIIKEIFNPFFTTKPSGEGTGLGLSISHDIVAVHGGDMTVTSEPNSFTEFTVALPVSAVEEEAEAIQ